ncbi:MAG: hypothetical protein IPK16_01555 [Anaerolineales bacterium]|nr:hypothetical protein [Anaerolineales bacterium]
MTFYARRQRRRTRTVFAFGVGRDPTTGQALTPYPDSEAKVSPCGRLQPCAVTLTTSWQPYTITLTGLDLSYVLGAFGWVVDPTQNNGQQVQFLIDDIQFHKSRLDEPRFIVSFHTRPTGLNFDTVA